MYKTISGVCLLLALSSASWALPGQIRPGAVAGGEKIAARFIENHIYLPVTVAGKERLWLLDCGAGASVIDKGLAQELGLEMSGEVKAMGAAGSVRTGFVTVPRLRVAGIELDSQPMVVLEIAELMRRNIGTEPAGILGYDFLSRFVTKVDFAREEVTFFRPESFAYSGPGRAIPMGIEANIPVVEMQVDGKYRGQWRLDIGAAVSVFHHHAVEKFGLAARPGVERLAAGMGGMQRHRLVRFADAELAGFKVKRPVISVPLEAGPGALSGTSVLGTVGNSVLHNFVLYLDYQGGRLIVEKGSGFGKPLVIDRSGLQVGRIDSGSFQVICAAPNTPADKAGFKTGDIIEAVDGQSPEALGGVGRLREMLRAAPGTRYQVAVRRGDAVLNLELKLEELL
jgi:predicted aspartyl protease